MKGSSEKALAVALESLTQRKAQNLNVLDLRGRSPMTDYFVICHGESERQVRSLAETLIELGELELRDLCR